MPVSGSGPKDKSLIIIWQNAENGNIIDLKNRIQK